MSATLFFKSDINLGTIGSLIDFRIGNYTTAGRPSTITWSGINIGYTYFDTTTKKVTSWDGTQWTVSGANLFGDVVSLSTGEATIQAHVINNGKLAQMSAHTFKGNNTGALGDVLDLTATEVTAELNIFTSTLKGLVPSSGGGVNNFLRADGTWAAIDTSGVATSLAGGNVGSIPYQSATGVTAMLPAGTSTYILQSNGAAPPSWIPNNIGDMILNAGQTNTGVKTFLDGTLALRNVNNTFNGFFLNNNTNNRTYTLQDASGTLAFLSDITAAIVGGMVNKGAYNAATNTPNLDLMPIAGIKNGWTYTVSANGTFFTQNVQVGDVIIANVDSPTSEANWTILNKNIPDIVSASETNQGIAEISTQGEVTTGTDDTRIVSPLKLRTELTGNNWIYTAPAFGNSALTSFAFTHGLVGGTLSPTVEITDTATKAKVHTQVVVTSATVVTIDFNTPPANNQYTVVIKK